MSRPWDRENNPGIYSNWNPEDLIRLEYDGGTADKSSWFQTSDAWKVRLKLTIPFNKYIWSNRLTEESYNLLMRKLGLKPASWIETWCLWNNRRKDPEFEKSSLPWDIRFPKEPLPTPPASRTQSSETHANTEPLPVPAPTTAPISPAKSQEETSPRLVLIHSFRRQLY